MSPRPEKIFRLATRPPIEVKLTHGLWRDAVDVYVEGFPRVLEHHDVSREEAEAKFVEVRDRWKAKHPTLDSWEYEQEFEWRWTRRDPKARKAV